MIRSLARNLARPAAFAGPVVAVGLAGVLVCAATLKLIALSDPARAHGDTVLGDALGEVAIIGFEYVAAGAIVAPRLRRFGALAVIAFLSLGTGIATAELGRPAPRLCGCFGQRPTSLDPDEVRQGLTRAIARNLGLMTCGTFVVAVSAGRLERGC